MTFHLTNSEINGMQNRPREKVVAYGRQKPYANLAEYNKALREHRERKEK